MTAIVITVLVLTIVATTLYRTRPPVDDRTWRDLISRVDADREQHPERES